ncbi:transcription factor A, mitochondrial [Bombina bombina]|uniref:transcription factor A, mitochondrial n=1 Tax=Bombina bombina TaxID=8345 RepID=UPI00235ADA37|nr:transcription factor A, mitochondrial [Bombina bombina]
MAAQRGRFLPTSVFFVKQMPILHKQHPEIKQVDRTRKIAQEWKELPQYIKEPFVTAASAEQLKFREEYRIYKESLTPSQLEIRREERRQRMAKSKSMKKKRELTVFGRPKRPRNAFNIFMSENYQEATGISMQSKMKSLRDDWKILPNSQKQTYVQLAEDDKIRYENEMSSWEEQMIDLGREDLIRRTKKRATRMRKVTAKRENVIETLKSDKIMKQQGNMMTKHEE